jgi:hypothetical protein
VVRNIPMNNKTEVINNTKSKTWIEKLQERWGVSASQVFIILIVFACTGFTVMFLKKPVVAFFTGGEQSLVFSITYYILILPVYNLFLLIYGFIFGQFKFFWEFEKRFFKRMFRIK